MAAGDPKRIVAAGYDRVAARYAALERPARAWPRERWLRLVLGRVPAGGRILDVGCGNGLPALRAVAERHSPTGIEISAVQAALARRNVPEARIVVADATNTAFTELFDAVTAFYVLDHLPRSEHATFFARVAGWLRTGGLFVFCVEPDDEPGLVGEWLGEPMFFSRFSAERTLELVRGAGFAVERTAVEAQLEGETEVSYLWAACRKLAPPPPAD